MKEIETVLDAEFRAQDIKQKNSIKLQLQKEKEKRQLLEAVERKREAEIKKLRSE